MSKTRKLKKKQKQKEKKWAKQRKKRGYSDCDIWNMRDWFISTVKPMIEQLRDNHMGFPESISRDWFEAHKEL